MTDDLTKPEKESAAELAAKLEHAIKIWSVYLKTSAEWPELQKLVDDFGLQAKALRLAIEIETRPGL